MLPVRTLPTVWARTVWACAQYEEEQNTRPIPRITSSYSRHAEEITRYEPYHKGMNTFADTFPRLDAGLQMILNVDWMLE